MKIDSFEVKNFRGIKKCKFTDFSSINIFIGKNGTGKSSILEAIYLASSKFYRDIIWNNPFIKVLNKRGWIGKELFGIAREMIYQYAPPCSILFNKEVYEFTVSKILPEDYDDLDEKTREEIEPEEAVVFRIRKKKNNRKVWYSNIIVWRETFSTELKSFIVYNEKFSQEFETRANSILVDESFLRDLKNVGKVFGEVMME